MKKILILLIIILTSCQTITEVEYKKYKKDKIELGQTWLLKNENDYRKYHIEVEVIEIKKCLIVYGFINGHYFIKDSLKENIFRRVYKLQKEN